MLIIPNRKIPNVPYEEYIELRELARAHNLLESKIDEEYRKRIKKSCDMIILNLYQKNIVDMDSPNAHRVIDAKDTKKTSQLPQHFFLYEFKTLESAELYAHCLEEIYSGKRKFIVI